MTASDLKSDSTVQPAKPRRRWYQFTLRTADLWIALFCFLLGSFAWWRDRAERQRKVVEELRGLGAAVGYRHFSLTASDASDFGGPTPDEFVPCTLLRRAFGDDFVYAVAIVDLRDIRNAAVPRETMQSALSLIEKCPAIKVLRLHGSAVSGADLKRLPCLTELEHLSLPKWIKGAPSLLKDSDLAILEDATSLKSLNLERQPIGDSGVKHLRNCRQIQSLKLDGTDVGDEGVQHFSKLTALVELDLSRTRVTDAGLKHLRSLNKLSDLNLQEDAVDGEGLAEIGAKPELRTLNLEGTNATDDSLRHLRQFPKLYNIQLGRTRITGAGVSHIAGLKSLQFVRFDGCPMTDEVISKMEIPEGWQVLSFAGTEVTDEGLRSLKLPSTLRSFHLATTSVTDKTLDHLQNLPNLIFLSVNDTQVTSTGIKRFETRHAGCEVRH